MTISPLVRYIGVAGVWLAISLIAVWWHVPVAQAPTDAIYGLLFFVGVYAGFLWASWPLFAEGTALQKAVVRIVFSVIATVAWLALNAGAAIAFQLAIGGSL